MQALGDDDKANISTTIDDDVLKGQRDHVPLDRRGPAPTAGSACRAS